MNINIKSTQIDLTDAIRDHVNKKIESLERFIAEDSVVYVEVAKTTMHHKNGEHFKAEIDIRSDGQKFFAMAEKEDLHGAIDQAKEDIQRVITYQKDKKEGLYRRGARSVKKMLKGLSKRNPFTSKY
jgi:putative sigma-54 modulation protein